MLDMRRLLSTVIISFNFLMMSPIEANHDPVHLSDLRHLLEGTSSGTTGYVHNVINITWGSGSHHSGGHCYTDNGGLINGLLAHTYGYTTSDFLSWLGSAYPKTLEFFHAIAVHNRFDVIANVTNIRAGDLLVIQNSQDPDFGYIMVVDRTPTHFDMEDPHVANTQQWIMPVIDCSTSAHGPKDTRYLGEGHSYPGLGRGIIRVYVDNHGAIVGHAWSRQKNEAYFSSTQRPIIVGRLVR